MRPTTDPRRAFVVIVGVERSGLFANDPLVGPIADAIRVFDWARGWLEVPPGRIRLFVSPKAQSQPMLDEWDRRCGAAKRSEANEAEVRNFITRDLASEAGEDSGPLIVVWTGHGVVDARGGTRERALFYADSTDAARLHADFGNLMATLASEQFNAFREQLLIVDACASWASRDLGRAVLGPSTNFGDTTKGRVRQFAVAAASPGEKAETGAGADGVVRSRFLERLMLRLEAEPKGAMPDFGKAYEDTKRVFQGDSQTPVSWARGNNGELLEDDHRTILPTVPATRLLEALERSALEADALRGAFRAALHPILEVESHAQAAVAGAEAMIRALSLAAIDGQARPPLHRFALESASRAGDLSRTPLVHWLNREGLSWDDIDAGIQACEQRRRPRVTRFLLIEETALAPDGGSEMTLTAWCFCGKDPTPRPLARNDESPFVVDAQNPIEQVLGEIVDEALGTGDDPCGPLVIEWALPEERMAEPLEHQAFSEGPGLVQLRHRYLVTRRLATRLHALRVQRPRPGWSSNIRAWRAIADLMRPRFERHGLQLAPLTTADLAEQRAESVLAEHAQASCLVVVRACRDGRLSRDAIKALAGAAVPFACWAECDLSEDEVARLQAELRPHVDHDSFSGLHALQRRHDAGTHPATRLLLFWDDPQRVPPIKQLQAERP